MTLLAEQKCNQRGRDFGLLFRNQYILSRSSKREQPSWPKKSLNGWTLHHGTGLHILEILDTQAHCTGFLLGHALAENSTLIRDALCVPAHRSDPDFPAKFENLIADLSGKYVAICLTKNTKRIYGDPVSDIPTLFESKTRRVASSIGLVLKRKIRPNPLFPVKNVISGIQTLSFGQTVDVSVNRVLPNHYLDLDQFELNRFWPSEIDQLTASSENSSEIIDEITARLTAHLKTWSSEFNCILPITGGRDTRTLLACASDFLHNVREFSGYRFNNTTKRDAKTGNMILASLGLPYKQYFKTLPSTNQIRDMRLKMGWSGYRGELGAIGCIERYPMDHVILRGNIMEILRANQYRRDKIGVPLHIVHAIRRTGAAPLAIRKKILEWEGPYYAWLEKLPQNAHQRVYDFGFLELLLPNSQGTYITAMHRTPFINPFNDRKLIHLALSLPPEIRIENKIYDEIIRRRNPKLLEIPFN